MQAGASAILFGPSLPGGGEPCNARFLAEVLIVEGPHPQRVPVQALTVRIGGADDDALFLNWGQGGGSFSLVLQDRAAQQTLLAGVPDSLAPQLRRWRVSAGVQRAKWNALLGALSLLLLLTLLAIWQSERLERWAADKIPLSTEESLGEMALKDLKINRRLTQEGAAAQAIQSIGQRLTEGSRYHYQWYLMSDDSVNAFALPGGQVVVHTALVEKTQSAEELAGVLAHEVQHIEQRHSLQQMIHSAGWASILLVSLGDVSAISAVILHQAGTLRNSRHLESQADAGAVTALVKAGISPAGMLSFFKRMTDEAPDSVALLSSHPLPAERLAQIDQAVKQQPCDCPPLAYDWATVRAEATRAR